MPNLHFNGYSTLLSGLRLKNVGHSVKVALSPATVKATPIGVSDGGLSPEGYSLAQFHFHWAARDDAGSEHRVSGLSYPLELHLVHVRSDLPDITAGVGEPDGLAVVGVFFHLVPEPEPNATPKRTPLDPLLDALDHVKTSNGTGIVDVMSLSQLLPSNRQSFYRYDGSLTTPPCSEAVVWTVLTESLPVTPSQLAKFRNVRMPRTDGGYDSTNARPVQPLGSRTLILRSPDIDIIKAYSAAMDLKPLSALLCASMCLIVSRLQGNI